jgi:nucleotidyltransferase/DNA polymerase involved in DNA repair
MLERPKDVDGTNLGQKVEQKVEQKLRQQLGQKLGQKLGQMSERQNIDSEQIRSLAGAQEVTKMLTMSMRRTRQW